MIKENELKVMENAGYRLSGDDANITVEDMKVMLEKSNEQTFNLPIKIYIDQLKTGGMFNSKTEDCLIISNTERSGYMSHCITMRKQMGTLIIQMYTKGASVLTMEYELVQARSNSGLFGKAINAIKGFDQAALDEEYAYYDMLKTTYGKIFC